MKTSKTGRADIHNIGHKIMVAKRYDSSLISTSLLTKLHTLVHPLPVERILQQIGIAAIERIQERCSEGSHAQLGHKRVQATEGLKYLNIQKYLPVSVKRIQELRLDRLPPQRILDLGSGAGYFLFIAKQFGHDCLGLDTDDAAVYGEMMAMLGVERLICRIEPFVALPDLGTPFDLVTAYQTLFNRYAESATRKKDERWNIAEWEFFLNDLCTHLKPDGSILLRLNRERKNQYITAELAEFFQSQGGEVRRTSVRFNLKSGKLPIRTNLKSKEKEKEKK